MSSLSFSILSYHALNVLFVAPGSATAFSLAVKIRSTEKPRKKSFFFPNKKLLFILLLFRSLLQSIDASCVVLRPYGKLCSSLTYMGIL